MRFRRAALVLCIVLALASATFVTVSRAATQVTTTALTLAQTLRTSGDPWDIAVDGATGRAYVTDAQENVLYVYDLSTAQPIAYVPTGRQPNHVVLVGSRAYVSNYTDQSLTVVDTTSLQPVETLAIGGLGLAANPSTNRLYAAAGSSIFVLDTAHDKLVATLPGPAGSNVWGLALDPSANRLYATDIASASVLVFDTTRNVLVSTIAIDAPARFAIAVAPLGRVIVASYTDKAPQISVIDGGTGRVVAHTATGSFVTSLAVDSGGNAYAASRADGTVTAVTTNPLAPVSQITLDRPHAPGAVAVGAAGGVIAVTSGGGAPPARALVSPVPVVRP